MINRLSDKDHIMTTLNLQTATNLVLEATTQEKINYALNVIEYPAYNCINSELTEQQKELMIEQLNINSCNLEVNGVI